MVDGKGRCGDCAVALGHLGILAEALSGGVGDWELRLVEAEEPDLAQQAAHIRGLLARAAEDLDQLSADLAAEIDRGAAGSEVGGGGVAVAPHLRMLRRTHLHLPEAREGERGDGHHHHHHHHGKKHDGEHEHEAPTPDARPAARSRWDEAGDMDEDLDAATEAELEEQEFERHRHR